MAGFNDLQTKYENINKQLRGSPTAFQPNVTPTTRDVSLDTQLKSVNEQIDALRSKQLRNKWYGASTATEETPPPNDGIVLGAIKALQKPLNAIAGTAQYALGKGTASSLAENINQATQSGLTFGNVLEQEKVPWGVAAPLGFTLDVMFDPVNWLTAGSAALVPRTGMGLVKGFEKEGLTGALKGASTGLTSSLEKKAATAMNMIPFAKGNAAYAGLAEKIGQKAITGAENFDTLVGKDVYSRLGTNFFGKGETGYLGNKAESLIRSIPETKYTPSGEKIADFLKYSPASASKIAEANDAAILAAREHGAQLVRDASKADFASAKDFLKQDARVIIKNKADDIVKDAEMTLEQPKLFAETPDQGVLIREQNKLSPDYGKLKPGFEGRVKVADTLENAQTFIDAADKDVQMKDLIAAYKVTAPGTTGVQWYDTFIDRLKATTVNDIKSGRLGVKPAEAEKLFTAGEEASNELVRQWNSAHAIAGNFKDITKGAVKNLGEIKIGEIHPFEKVLNALETTTAIFKASKVAMNAGSHVIAAAGNLFMGAMVGLPVYKKAYLQSIWNASRLVRGKLGASGIYEMFYNDANMLIDMAVNNPTRFKQLTGMDPSEIANKIDVADKIKKVLGETFSEVKKEMIKKLEGVERGLAADDLLNAKDKIAESAMAQGAASKVEKKAMLEEMGKFKTPQEKLAEMLKTAPIRGAEDYGTFSTAELGPNATLDLVKARLSSMASANPDNIAYNLANKLFNGMPKWYEHIDQAYKLGTVDYITRVGLTEQELQTISRVVKIDKSDILEPVISGGEKLYRLKPLKAADVALEAYMNYSAMPDFVKVMRAMPVIGSNFFSFQYAIAAKTAKTAINNPALFNKVGYALSEFSGQRSPQEKKALLNKYNQYLNSPTVVKLSNMMNVDLKGLIPWYTMNMFNPSEKTYDDSAQGQLLKQMDKLPLFQTPVGQVFKDYILQPMVLSGTGQTPQGQFGQPILPSYDENGKLITPSLGTRAFYAGRTLAETMSPGTLNYLGYLNGFLDLDPSVIELMPYGMRSAAYSAQGKTSIGASTKTDPFRKALLNATSRSGLPIYELNPTKTSTK